MPIKIRKGDKVKIMLGKDNGKVVRVLLDEGKVLVEGVNVLKKHVKPGEVSKEGGIISVERPINVSDVMLVCPNCKKTTRVGFGLTKSGKKARICKKCGEIVDKKK
jgi:large subunit ribosomal protein L24